MARNFTNENFERFLQQSADSLRMRASDRVWKGIAKNLNQRRRRLGYGLGIALLIMTGAGYFFITNPSENNQPGNQAQPVHQLTTIIEKDQAVRMNDEALASREVQPLAKSTSGEGYMNRRQALVSSPRKSIEIGLPEKIAGDDPALASNNFTPTITDDSFADQPEDENKTANEEEKSMAADPLTIESVVNSYQPKRGKKLSLQLFFTPTVSYRKLSENKAYVGSVAPGNVPLNQQGLYDINNAVTHKPDFGLEVGMAAKYPISENISLRGGVQFNINRYDIKVFHSSTRLATITLNDRNRTNSLNAITNYNTSKGYKTNWLENFYFQVSAPIGVEAIIKGDEKVKFGIASTVQPTYVLGDRAYLLSSDYQNYVEVPWLIRRWNINTNLETFVAYSTGHLNWQVGPQVRYQLLSSFVKQYPVKENLFDFGLKVGVGLNK